VGGLTTNTHSKPKNIVRGVTIQKQEKSIVQIGKEKCLFCVANQAAITRHGKMGNVNYVTGADTRQLTETITATYHDKSANLINIRILDETG
jgi:phage host-nuclease inhibitor protein Gam